MSELAKLQNDLNYENHRTQKAEAKSKQTKGRRAEEQKNRIAKSRELRVKRK